MITAALAERAREREAAENLLKDLQDNPDNWIALANSSFHIENVEKFDFINKQNGMMFKFSMSYDETKFKIEIKKPIELILWKSDLTRQIKKLCESLTATHSKTEKCKFIRRFIQGDFKSSMSIKVDDALTTQRWLELNAVGDYFISYFSAYEINGGQSDYILTANAWFTEISDAVAFKLGMHSL